MGVERFSLKISAQIRRVARMEPGFEDPEFPYWLKRLPFGAQQMDPSFRCGSKVALPGSSRLFHFLRILSFTYRVSVLPHFRSFGCLLSVEPVASSKCTSDWAVTTR
ncbi:hypothetical protein CUMW_037850 [Citrus unshiu]|nr:hypothetical protein CUMW_037850 [Citrus unshiu]